MRRSPSWYHITTRSLFLSVALGVGLVLWYLPTLLNLDAFRPALTDLLQETFHCNVFIGNVNAQLVPYPGLSVSHVVFLENGQASHVLASVNFVRLSVSTRALWKGHLEAYAIRFVRPRFIIHHELTPYGDTRWALLTLPRSESNPEAAHPGINLWQIQKGSIEIWDHAQKPARRWIADQFDGSFQVRRQTGALVGKVAGLGPQASMDLHYDGAAAFPLKGRIATVQLPIFQPLLHTSFFKLQGLSDIAFKIRLEPSLRIHATLDQPSSAGQLTVTASPGKNGAWQWYAEGKNARLSDTAFQLSEWSAKNDLQNLAVYARGMTQDGGMVEVGWNTPAGVGNDALLDIDASSVTMKQILVLSGTPASSHGWDPWRLDRGSLEATIHSDRTMDVKECDIDFRIPGQAVEQPPMHLDLTGFFGLTGSTVPARIQGSLENIPAEALLNSFFPAPSPITGTGQFQFTLAFPLSKDWTQGLSGTLQGELDQGILRALKTVYRVISVLNLGNYLRLRFPNIDAQGIEIETLAGHFIVQNGVIATDDLFLKSPNMNVGAKGSVNLPGRRLDVTLRLEMFRFLEDILRDVPITHWIFKKPNKIFLPLVVKADGPWNDVNIH
jgi:hypothetical protein